MEATADLVELCADGLALLDSGGRFRDLNTAAATILGARRDELLGRTAPFDTAAGAHDRLRTAWPMPGGRRRDLDYRLAPAPGGGYAVWFSDVTRALRQRERLTAITRAASTVADVGSLRVTLDAVAREIVMTANIAAVQILALDEPDGELRVLGMAGFGDVTGFIDLLAACRARGVRVLFLDVLRTRKRMVVPHRKPIIMADPAWEPLHAVMGGPDWDCFVSVPLVVRGRALGVINAYYAPGEDPGPDSLAFLEAMADHAAVAVDTAALLAGAFARAQLDERRRLARELHDSAVQQLFSMRMQARALLARLERPDADPAQLRDAAGEVAELATSALADLRGLVFELRPLDLAERGLVDTVRAHAASIEARTGLLVDVRCPPGLRVDAGLEAQEDLYRIVQEALHNVVKHAHATAVTIAFTSDGAGLTIEVTDDGRGRDPAGGGPADSGPADSDPTDSDPAGSSPAAGSPADGGAAGDRLGLVSMRERAQSWGGRFAAGPRSGTGWRVRVTLPATASWTGR